MSKMLTLHTITENIKHIKDALNIRREELAVKLDLGRMETRDELHDLEKKARTLKEKSKHAAEETGEFAKVTVDAAKHLTEESTEVAKITMDTAKHIGTDVTRDIKKGIDKIRHH